MTLTTDTATTSHPATLTSTARKLLLCPDEVTKNLWPEAREISHQGVQYWAAPYDVRLVKALRGFGHDIPSPIYSQYDWPKTPFAVQRRTAAMLTVSQRAYVLNDIGTGKTRSALYAFDFLKKEGVVDKMLVVAPMSTMTPTWMREIFMCFPHLKSCVLHGTKDKRLQYLDNDYDIYIINHDGVKVIGDELAATKFDVVTIDELATFRNASTKRWKVLKKIVEPRDFVWGLTGSPTPTSPVDAWAQCRLLTPHTVPSSRRRFEQLTMIQVSEFTWVPRQGAKDLVHAAMQPAIRYTRAECIDLPPTTYSDRQVPLGPRQKAIYKKVKSELAVLLQEGAITAANAGVLYSKLIQIAAGIVYTSDGTPVVLDGQARIKELEDIINSTEKKVLVFAPYRHMVAHISEQLAKNHSVATIHGGVGKAARDKIFYDFQTADEPRVIVAHPRTMAHGLTLTEANTVVWFAPPPGAEFYEQANGRITRPGQTTNTHIIHLYGTKAEEKAYKNTKGNLTAQALLLELFEEGTN